MLGMRYLLLLLPLCCACDFMRDDQACAKAVWDAEAAAERGDLSAARSHRATAWIECDEKTVKRLDAKLTAAGVPKEDL